MITRAQAWQKLNELMENKNLIKHSLAVESAMLAYADHFGVPSEEREKWSVVGLLHDADYEKHPDEHPRVILEWLRQNAADDEVLNAVAAHGFEFGIAPQTRMAKCLRAVDELTGLIVAVTLVRESKKLADVSVKSVLRKWKDQAFARGVNRANIEQGAQEIDVPLEKHIQIVLTAMHKISDQLGL